MTSAGPPDKGKDKGKGKIRYLL